MDCESYTRDHRRIRCEHWNQCHQLGYSLCEVGREFHKSDRPTKTPWPERRQQILELAKEKGTIDTTAIMEHTNAARTTTCIWLKRLTDTGDLQRLTRAILAGPNSRPATFAIARKED